MQQGLDVITNLWSDLIHAYYEPILSTSYTIKIGLTQKKYFNRMYAVSLVDSEYG